MTVIVRPAKCSKENNKRKIFFTVLCQSHNKICKQVGILKINDYFEGFLLNCPNLYNNTS